MQADALQDSSFSSPPLFFYAPPVYLTSLAHLVQELLVFLHFSRQIGKSFLLKLPEDAKNKDKKKPQKNPPKKRGKKSAAAH
jgi:hypothetical protein